jgi:formate dehydrogenase major subunit/formate dehydrogenase alpha subunit
MNGSKIFTLGYARGLDRFTALQIDVPVFKEADLLEELVVSVFAAKGVRGEKLDVDNGIRIISEKLSGYYDVSGFNAMKNSLLGSSSVSIVFGPDLVQRTDGHRSIFAVAGLTYLLEARLYLLSERPNEQGLIDMGCVPDMLPGGRPVDIHDFRSKFDLLWNGTVPAEDGLTLLEMMESMKRKEIKALYIMGDNPVFNLPDRPLVTEALEALDFLVVQDLYLSETAEMADVVFPATGWTETSGTYTNLERRIQLQKKAVHVTAGMDDWKIISDLSCKMGYHMSYADAEDIMNEIAEVSPLYRDLSYREISRGNCLWPYHGEPLRGKINELPSVAESEDTYEADFYLAPDKPLFHSGTLSRMSPSLNRISPEPALKMSDEAADKLGLGEGDRVTFSTSLGSGEARVSIDYAIRDNKVLFSNNFRDNGVYGLMNYKMDRITKAPGIEGCEVSIKKMQEH